MGLKIYIFIHYIWVHFDPNNLIRTYSLFSLDCDWNLITHWDNLLSEQTNWATLEVKLQVRLVPDVWKCKRNNTKHFIGFNVMSAVSSVEGLTFRFSSQYLMSVKWYSHQQRVFIFLHGVLSSCYLPQQKVFQSYIWPWMEASQIAENGSSSPLPLHFRMLHSLKSVFSHARIKQCN